MKTCSYFIIFCSFLFCLSCNNDVEDRSSDDQILFNLAKDGKNDPELLFGEWDIVGFAFTSDGNKISKATGISDVFVGRKFNPILIHDINQWLDDIVEIEAPGLLLPLSFGGCTSYYSVSGNLMSFLRITYCFAAEMTLTDEEYEVWNAWENTHGFVIKGDKLFIHFTRNKNKNLLILKKR